MTDTPEQHEDQANDQDLSLEAQLDALIGELEKVDPESVPPDLRKNKVEAPEPVAQQDPEPEPVPAKAVEPQTTEAQPAEPQPEPEPVPIAAEEAATTEPPASLESIASMASNLLDQQIEETIEAASSLTDTDETEAEATTNESAKAATPQPQAEASKPEPEAEAPKPAGGLSEDALGDQIQALLNDIQAPKAPADATPAPAATAETTPGDAEKPAEAEEPAEAGAVSIQQIDAMLADSAEQAIEQPEATEHVPGTDEILAAQAETEAEEAQAKATAETEAQNIEAAPEPQPAPDPAPVQTEPQPQPAQSFDAGATDVAKELDEDPQAQPATASPAPAPEPAAAAAPASAEAPAQPVAAEAGQEQPDEPPAVVIDPSGLKKAEHTIYRICGKINSPLNRLSPEMRDTVGWVGVATLGFGFFMFLYGVIF